MMKNTLLLFITLLFAQDAFAQPLDIMKIPGKLDIPVKGEFKKVEENFETFWHGRPPSKEHGQQLHERGVKRFIALHPDTIQYIRNGKHTIATQEVVLDYRLNPNGYIYSIESTNARTLNRIGIVSTEWKNDRPSRIDEGGKLQYYKLLQYDKSGKLLTSTRLSKRNNKVYSVTQYEYGTNPADLTRTTSSRKGTLTQQVVVKYSSKKKARISTLSSKKEVLKFSDIKYNRRGHPTLIKTTDVKKKKTSETKFKYKYGKNGNWTKLEKTTDGLLMEKREREYQWQ